MGKKTMEGMQKGASEDADAYDYDPIYKAIKDRKKAISESVSGWFKPEPTPKPKPE